MQLADSLCGELLSTFAPAILSFLRMYVEDVPHMNSCGGWVLGMEGKDVRVKKKWREIGRGRCSYCTWLPCMCFKYYRCAVPLHSGLHVYKHIFLRFTKAKMIQRLTRGLTVFPTELLIALSGPYVQYYRAWLCHGKRLYAFHSTTSSRPSHGQGSNFAPLEIQSKKKIVLEVLHRSTC